MGCRSKELQGELLRVRRDPEDGLVKVDVEGHGPGRGAYVHRRETCVRLAARRRSLPRALRAALSEAENARLNRELDEVVRERS